MAGIPAPALLSVLKQLGSEPFWDAKRLAAILDLKTTDVPQVLATLQMLGYIEPAPGKKRAWRNTAAGNTVSGTKPPRFNRDSVLEAIQELRKRAGEMNGDPSVPFRIKGLLAFGDFLDERPKVQAADVGVALVPRRPQEAGPETAVERKHEEQALAGLKAKSAMLQLHRLEDWMRRRAHQDLQPSS